MNIGRTLIGVGILLFATAAFAIAKPQVSLRLSAFLVQQKAGRISERPLGSRTLQAGDRVRFVLVARNSGSSAALKFIPSDPIPAHMSYVPGSAKDGSAAVQFTLDGKTWSAHPLVTMKTRKGTVHKPADASLYKAIRWVARVPLAANAASTYSFEAQVNGHKAGAK